MNRLKADVTGLRETSRNMDSYRKESGFYREIAALDPATGRAVVTARIYIPGSTSYCAIWISGPDAYGRGLGKAGGYGYHKPSAALAEAIRDAGVILRGDIYGREKINRPADIGGVGDSVMVEAVEAIARAVTGKRRFIVHTAHP